MNDTVNQTAVDNGIGVHEAELWIQIGFFYMFLCGVVTTLGNALIIAGIFNTTDLRNRFFYIICFLSVCRGGLSLQMFVMGVYRALRTFSILPIYQMRLTCNFIHFWFLHGLTLELMLLMFLVVDRSIALVATLIYRKLTDPQAVYMCIFIYMLCFGIKTVPAYLLGVENPQEIVQCVNVFSATSELMNVLSRYFDLLLVFILLATYCALLCYMRCHIKGKHAGMSPTEKAVLERQLALLSVLKHQVLLHCSLTMISKSLLFSATFVPPNQSARVSLYGGVFLALDVFVNTMALLVGNKEIRTACLEVLGRGKGKGKNAVNVARTVSVAALK